MNIYVSQLNFHTTSESLYELFAAYGTVASANIINDRETGRSRGFGFVEMLDDNEAQRAIQQLNDQEFEGRTIRVNEARPRTESTDRPRFGNRRDSHRSYESRNRW